MAFDRSSGSSATSPEIKTNFEPIEFDDQNHRDTPSTRKLSLSAADRVRRNASAKLANPLAGISHAKLEEMGATYALKHHIGDEEDIRAFQKGAILAQDPRRFSQVQGLTGMECDVLQREFSNRWSQPKLMYIVIILCSTCAAVQGMDEAVVNGGQLWYKYQFGIGGEDPRSTWLTGLLNSAPYLCCAFIGCWLTTPFNNLFGRRGTIFLTCVFSALACFWQGFVNTWWHMFIARFFLGLGIGPKSATVPIYAAETTPPAIRGALVMQWQMWTAFGIMFGYVADLAFYTVGDRPGVVGLNWRLMMASAMLPALIVIAFVFMCPESPRWYMSKNRHYKAYQSMVRLRYEKVQAARDVFYMNTLLEAEKEVQLNQGNPLLELVKIPRNRRAMLASEIVMFMQQFCGVNVIAYYSSQIFLDGGFSVASALAASLGFGLVNWIFALPAVYTIDTFGRRNLLLTTFPLMSICMFFTGFSFWIPEDTLRTPRVACISLGIYLFAAVYSPGEGPVPFTYSAEAYPLYIRTVGMSLATSTTWFFNFILSITWPSLQTAFTTQGAFSWYGGWNIIGFILVLLFLPETKAKTLEELDQVFSVPTHIHAAYGLRQVPYFFKRYLLWQHAEPERLYEHDDTAEDKDLGYDDPENRA
ncbi:putative MFS sugar transporter [Usnea florida]